MDRAQSYWEKSTGIHASMLADAPLLPQRSDVLIVGAGFAGLWLAYFLKQRRPNLQITVIERDYFAFGASARNAGFLSCGNISEWCEDAKAWGPEETFKTLRARILGVQTMLDTFGEQIAPNRCGSVDLDMVDDEKTAFMHGLNAFLASEGHKVHFSIKPHNIGGKQRSVFFNASDRGVNPCDVLLGLRQKLSAAGVVISGDTTVESISDGHAHVRRDEQAIDLQYSHAYLCTNAFTRRLYPESQVMPARGQILITAPCQTQTEKTLGFENAGYDYFRFVGDRLLVGGGRLQHKTAEDTDHIAISESIAAYLRNFAARILGHQDFQIEHHWAGIMGMHTGEHASVSAMLETCKIDDKTETSYSCGGWGVAMSPYVAREKSLRW